MNTTLHKLIRAAAISNSSGSVRAHPCQKHVKSNTSNGSFTHTHARTHTHTQSLYGSLNSVRANPGELVPEETFTHSHLSWSSVIPYLLPPSIMIHGILPVQFMCLTVFFHNLCPTFLWSTSWPGTLNFILHTFLHQIIVFVSCPYYRNLFCYNTEINRCQVKRHGYLSRVRCK